MAFQTAVDIANRAIQYCGARRISTLGDNSKQAAEVNFCYDKLRRAELRRGVWRFATRRAMLQPYNASTIRYLPLLWSNITAYAAGQIVQDASGQYWIAVIANTSTVPGTSLAGSPAVWQEYFGPVFANGWDSTRVYNAGDVVYYVGQIFYINTMNNVVGASPVSGTPWVTLPGSGANYATLPLLQPVGPGLVVNTRARNMFPLPNGFLRLAAPDPKVESTDTLATTGGVKFLDWQLENTYLVSNTTNSLLIRFVADLQDVPAMDDMFCEALAARIALSICEPLTQSADKLRAISAAYQTFMGDARLINWIETGSTEPKEEDYEEAANEAVTPGSTKRR